MMPTNFGGQTAQQTELMPWLQPQYPVQYTHQKEGFPMLTISSEMEIKIHNRKQ
jgi:hypothetical protein